MTTKMFTHLGMAGLLTLLPGMALSQTMSFVQVDTDGNGALGLTELTAAFGTEGAARVLADQDANGDGMLSQTEAAMTTGSAPKPMDGTEPANAEDDSGDNNAEDGAAQGASGGGENAGDPAADNDGKAN
jgi:hypothetical protein